MYSSSSVNVKTMSELRAHFKTCDDQKRIIFLKAGASWCGPCQQMQPFYDALMTHWSKTVKLSTVTFSIDDAQQISVYFNVTQIPYFICLLPSEHPTLTLSELHHEGGNHTKLEQWVTNIMQKWTTGVHAPFQFENVQPREVPRWHCSTVRTKQDM